MSTLYAFKLFRRDLVKKIYLVSSGALISAEFICQVSRAEAGIVEVGVHHRPRVAGSQTGARLSVISKAIREFWLVWWSLRRTRA